MAFHSQPGTMPLVMVVAVPAEVTNTRSLTPSCPVTVGWIDNSALLPAMAAPAATAMPLIEPAASAA